MDRDRDCGCPVPHLTAKLAALTRVQESRGAQRLLSDVYQTCSSSRPEPRTPFRRPTDAHELRMRLINCGLMEPWRQAKSKGSGRDLQSHYFYNICIYAYIYIYVCILPPPHEPHVEPFYTVNTNKNCHFWVTSLKHRFSILEVLGFLEVHPSKTEQTSLEFEFKYQFKLEYCKQEYYSIIEEFSIYK